MKKRRHTFLTSLIKSQKGEINLVAVTVTITLTLAVIILIKNMFTVNEVIQKRLNAYSCFGKSLNSIKKTTRFFIISNATIASSQAAQIVTPSPHWRTVIKSAQISQNLYLAKYLKSSFSNKDCISWNQTQVAKSFPFKHRGLFIIRDNLGMAILKKKKGTLSLKALSRSPFVLTANYKFTPLFKLKNTYEKSSSILSKVLSH